MNSCCPFCSGLGMSSCCRLSGCWARPETLPAENKETESRVLAVALSVLGEDLRNPNPEET